MAVEIPNKIDSHFDIIIPGIESEEVEEINDAYKDILEELGKNDTKIFIKLSSLSMEKFPLFRSSSCN